MFAAIKSTWEEFHVLYHIIRQTIDLYFGNYVLPPGDPFTYMDKL